MIGIFGISDIEIGPIQTRGNASFEEGPKYRLMTVKTWHGPIEIELFGGVKDDFKIIVHNSEPSTERGQEDSVDKKEDSEPWWLDEDQDSEWHQKMMDEQREQEDGYEAVRGK